MPQSRKTVNNTVLPTGVKYIKIVSAFLTLYGIIILLMFLSVLFNSNGLVIEWELKQIFSLLLNIGILVIGYLIYIGFGEIKYWAWKLAFTYYIIISIINIATFNFIFLPIPMLFIWYLYRRKEFFQTGKIIKNESCLKQEKIFKYLFWIIFVSVITIEFFFSN